MIELRNGKWFGVKICEACNEPLSDHEINNNDGVCPECGVMSENNKVVTNTVVIRYITTGSFLFRDSRFEVRENDHFAKEWLEKFGHQLKHMI